MYNTPPQFLSNSRFYGIDLANKTYLRPPVALTAVHSKAVSLFLFNHCLLLLPLGVPG